MLNSKQLLLSTVILSSLVLAVPTLIESIPKSLQNNDNLVNLYQEGHPRLAQTVGWISIGFWLTVSVEQLYLSYVQQSGEGLSLIFLAIWLAGDLTNLGAAYWQDLLPTMIILGAYYAICDIILISQVFYYRRKRSLYPELFLPSTPTLVVPVETDPLLSAFSASGSPSHPYSKQVKKYRDLISYIGALIAIILLGFVAWKLSGNIPEKSPEVWDTKAQIVGWISAFLYLGSRLPQITKNMETKCQGLSLLMFAFSVAGNFTYVASILLQSLSTEHLLINASWLVGSGGTIGLDFIVLAQFWWYAKARKEELAAGEIFSRVPDNEVEDDDL